MAFRGCGPPSRRRGLVTAGLGRHGNRSPDTRTRPRGASLHALRRRMTEPEARTRRPKIATVGAPRGARSRSQGDARRLASASACRSTPGVLRKHPAPSRRSTPRHAGKELACPRESGGERGARARISSGRRSFGCLTSEEFDAGREQPRALDAASDACAAIALALCGRGRNGGAANPDG